jgi:hypothetical protein
MRRLLHIVALALAALFAASPAMAQLVQGKRVALVIGNSDYRHTARLENPANDAADMAAALARLGFTVIEGRDLVKSAMERKLLDFANALQGAQAGFFFYAGHGLQVAGQNYLVPVDTEMETATATDFELVRLDLVHRTMERATSTNILIVDACRDNPLARNLARALGTRSSQVGHGLAAAESGEGTLIGFSTQPGNVALDGAGRNSPYAAALLKHIAVPGDDLSTILINVRNDVMQATARRQVPWEHSALTAKFYFTPPVPAAPNAEHMELTFWLSVKDSKDPAVIRTYLDRYPAGTFAPIARAQVEALARQEPKRQEAARSPASPAQQPKTGAVQRLAAPKPVQAGGLFSEADAKRVQAIAERNQLPQPDYRFEIPGAEMPDALRRFVGVWADEKGGPEGRDRKHMLLVTRVDKDGRADGYLMTGPPAPASQTPSPPNFFRIAGAISGDTLNFTNQRATESFKLTLTSDGRLSCFWSHASGLTSFATFEPVWTLVAARQATAKDNAAAAGFDGVWRIEFFPNEYCSKTDVDVVDWIVNQGAVLAKVRKGIARGTVSPSGDVEAHWPNAVADDVTNVMVAKLQGSQGEGTYQIQGRRCGGTVRWTRK